MDRQAKARATQPDSVTDVLCVMCVPTYNAHIRLKIDCMTSEKRSHPIFYQELDPCILTDVRNPLDPHKHSFSVVFLRKLVLRHEGMAVTNLDHVVQSLQN